MKRLLALALAALMTLTACHAPDTPELPDDPIPEQEVSIPEDIPFQLAVYDRYSLHPILAENRANLALSGLLYEPLFALNDAFEVEPVLCEDWTVREDGLVWDFTLRSGITFSDGTPLTGEIVAAALNNDPQLTAMYAAVTNRAAATTADVKFNDNVFFDPDGGKVRDFIEKMGFQLREVCMARPAVPLRLAKNKERAATPSRRSPVCRRGAVIGTTGGRAFARSMPP